MNENLDFWNFWLVFLLNSLASEETQNQITIIQGLTTIIRRDFLYSCKPFSTGRSIQERAITKLGASGGGMSLRGAGGGGMSLRGAGDGSGQERGGLPDLAKAKKGVYLKKTLASSGQKSAQTGADCSSEPTFAQHCSIQERAIIKLFSYQI